MVAVILIDNNTELYGKIAELIDQTAAIDPSMSRLPNSRHPVPGPQLLSNSGFRKLPDQAGESTSCFFPGTSLVQNVGANASITSFSGITVHLDECRIQIDGHEVILNMINFRLLHFFITHPEKVFSRRQLLNRVPD